MTAQPPYLAPAYRSTHKRAPLQPLVAIAPTLEATGPQFPRVDEVADLAAGAVGERIVVAGRVTDAGDRPVANALIELWQANAAGRYHHPVDTHDAPLDPQFRGIGRVFSDANGRYSFVTIKPGAYPWANHDNAWRPCHIHFSLFGATWAERLVTQMYFEGDPLLAIDPIFQAVPDAGARDRLVARFDLALTRPGWALGYRFDLTFVDSSQTIGPFWHGLPERRELADETSLAGTVLDGDGAPVTDACVELWQPGVGFGRCATDAHGRYHFRTRAVPAAVAVFARGLLKAARTRVYFDDRGELPELPPARRRTLFAERDGDGWRWDIRLQGEGETVFFELRSAH